MALVAVFEKAKQLKDILGRIVRRDTDLDGMCCYHNLAQVTDHI
jgi:hypothetical protein